MIDLRNITKGRFVTGRAHDDQYRIVCHFGEVIVWSGRDLAYRQRRPGSVSIALQKLPFVRQVQDGSEGIVLVFPAAEFDAVVSIIQPRIRSIAK